MTTDVIATGTTTRTQRIVRAHHPDGRIEDSAPQDARPGSPLDDALAGISALFGRRAFPPGTRFERMERTVTTTATGWVVVDRVAAS